MITCREFIRATPKRKGQGYQQDAELRHRREPPGPRSIPIDRVEVPGEQGMEIYQQTQVGADHGVEQAGEVQGDEARSTLDTTSWCVRKPNFRDTAAAPSPATGSGVGVIAETAPSRT